jgi:dTMP kinase
MTKVQYYGAGLPYKKIEGLPGKLIVLEGTDGVGRSTQIEMPGTGWKSTVMQSPIPACAVRH